jgi:hypothetical protein
MKAGPEGRLPAHTHLLPLRLQIITIPWCTIILDGENAQLEGEGCMYSIANIMPSIFITRKSLPPPPYTPWGYKFSLKTLQINSHSEKKTMPQK